VAATVRARLVTPSGDDVLVARAQAGDDAAFNALYHRHARYIAGVAYRLLGRDSEIDDIVQETFVDALMGLRGLDDPSRLRAWLVRIAVRRVHRRLARRRRQRWIARLVLREAAVASDPRDREQADALYRALDTLPDKVRVPWMLYRIEHAELDDVAKSCGVSVATAKRRIADAEQRIQRRLDAR